MKSKAPLALMEQLVMVLVVALAAALCLQAFTLADQISRRNAEQGASFWMNSSTVAFISCISSSERPRKGRAGMVMRTCFFVTLNLGLTFHSSVK